MKEYGENVGMAFQIQDDLLDYLGRKSIIGKPTGIDIKEKKLTLPLIYALEHAPGQESRKAMKIIKDGARQKDIQWVLDFVGAHGGIDYAVGKAAEFGRNAVTQLSCFENSPTKDALNTFVDYVLARTS
jgi:octaprenyl-diphosphate synthase